MSAHEQVFGQGVQFDAKGNPIERGFGNLTDRAKPTAAAEVAVAPTAPTVATEAATPDAAAAPAAHNPTATEVNAAIAAQVAPDVAAVIHEIEHVAHEAEVAIAAEVAKL